MINPTYKDSLDLIDAAEQQERAGNLREARACWNHAGEIQAALVRNLPPEKHRTRAIFGISAAACLFRGGELERATQALNAAYTAWWEDSSHDDTTVHTRACELAELIRRERSQQATLNACLKLPETEGFAESFDG